MQYQNFYCDYWVWIFFLSLLTFVFFTTVSRSCFISSYPTLPVSPSPHLPISIFSIYYFYLFSFTFCLFYSESIAFLRTSAEWEREPISSGVRGLGIILTTPFSDTMHGTLRQTSLIPNSPSIKVDTVSTLF
jgi:hypothetical protein